MTPPPEEKQKYGGKIAKKIIVQFSADTGGTDEKQGDKLGSETSLGNLCEGK
jgi:hypothetical protein